MVAPKGLNVTITLISSELFWTIIFPGLKHYILMNIIEIDKIKWWTLKSLFGGGGGGGGFF